MHQERQLNKACGRLGFSDMDALLVCSVGLDGFSGSGFKNGRFHWDIGYFVNNRS